MEVFSDASEVLMGTLRFTHIWSPPDLQDSVLAITGTGLLSYIRPVGEEFWILWPR